MRFLDVDDLVDFVAHRLTKYPTEVRVQADEDDIRVVVTNDTDAIATGLHGQYPEDADLNVVADGIFRQLTVAFACLRLRRPRESIKSEGGSDEEA